MSPRKNNPNTTKSNDEKYLVKQLITIAINKRDHLQNLDTLLKAIPEGHQSRLSFPKEDDRSKFTIKLDSSKVINCFHLEELFDINRRTTKLLVENNYLKPLPKTYNSYFSIQEFRTFLETL